MTSRRLFIEGSVFANKKSSGIAYATINIIQALCESPEITHTKKVLIITRDTLEIPTQLAKLPNLIVKKLPISSKILRLICRLPINLPVGLLIGRGAYIFPNFYNFSVPFSQSITFIHDVSFINYPETIQAKNLRFLTKNIQRWIKRSDIIATLSLSAEKQLIEKLGIPKDKTIIVKVPLRRDIFKPCSSVSIEASKQKYKLPNKYILYVGNIEPRKNLERFIAAFSQSDALKEGISLVILGADRWFTAPIESQISKAALKGASIVIPKDFIDDIQLPTVISGALFLCQPSLDEGFGIPPTQALACGVPVIVSDIPVMHEVVGEAAVYFQATSVEDITKKINEMLNLVHDHHFLQQQRTLSEKYLAQLEPSVAIRSLIKVTV